MGAEPAYGTTFFLDCDMQQAEAHPLAAGDAVVYSARSPDKDSANEDAAALIAVDEHRAIVAVADGLGGHSAGAQAASAALAALDDAVRGTPLNGSDLREAILNGFEFANQAVTGLGVGAGTTLAVLEIQQHSVRPYHVGDSMIIATGQRGRLRFQTVSHSPVGYAVESGMLAEAEAMHHEDRHLVSNMVGSTEMRIEIGPLIELKPRDTLLVASDGLFDNLHTDEIVARVRKGQLDKVAATLAADCGQRMRNCEGDHPSKPDDMTFVLFRLNLRR